MSIKAVIFDAFGTTIRYGTRRFNPYSALIRSSAKKLTPKQFMTSSLSFEAFATPYFDTHQLELLTQQLKQELSDLERYPEVEECFTRLKAMGIKIGICSNLAQPYGAAVRDLLKDADQLILSYEEGFMKPDPEIYTIGCERFNLSPEKIFFVGDSFRCDYEAPRNFGMQAYWLERRKQHTLMNIFDKF